ncbi:MAG: hypothetical protein IIZ17_08470 [Eubacteriaceae bacterium]|nr:hypothetical protein [Eubacteriaceae bacterium]
MRKTLIPALLLSFIIICCACGRTTSHYDMWVSFDCDENMTVTEEEESIRAENDSVSLLILRRDATPYASEDASGWEKEKLDLESGAFDGNFNNTLFVYEFFKYLASEDMSISPPSQDRIGKDGAMCFRCPFTSPDSCGEMYETVRDGVLYVIVIRISDDISNKEKYEDTIGAFTGSIQF